VYILNTTPFRYCIIYLWQKIKLFRTSGGIGRRWRSICNFCIAVILGLLSMICVNGKFTANTVTQFTSLHVAYITDLLLAKNSSVPQL